MPDARVARARRCYGRLQARGACRRRHSSVIRRAHAHGQGVVGVRVRPVNGVTCPRPGFHRVCHDRPRPCMSQTDGTPLFRRASVQPGPRSGGPWHTRISSIAGLSRGTPSLAGRCPPTAESRVPAEQGDGGLHRPTDAGLSPDHHLLREHALPAVRLHHVHAICQVLHLPLSATPNFSSA
jgi:hypothetical protein